MSVVFYDLEPCFIQSIADIESATFSDPYTIQMVESCVSSQLYKLSVVGVIDDNVCGYILATEVCGDAEILRIAIDSKYRSMGFGSQLLNEFITKCKKIGVNAVLLEVRFSNNVARSLYEKFGFKVVGTRKGYYADNGEDAVLYTLSMNGGD